MDLKESENARLDGWKDIAAQLGKSVRTVQVWERDHGLPVHREMKRVWAIPAELAAWREGHQELAVGIESPGPEAPVPLLEPEAGKHVGPWRFRRAAWLAVPLLATGVLFGFLWHFGPPVDYRVQGSVLTIIDDSQRALWQHSFPTIVHEEARSGPNVLPHLRGQFIDLDGDGDQEFLYRYWPWDMGKHQSSLLCFNRDGSVRWAFEPGRPSLALADGRSLAGTYTASQVAFLAHPRKDGGRIVVASNHAWDWPSQVAILTVEGKLVDEYWHPGWFFTLDVADLDEDGHDEILLGGVNNAYAAASNRSATLVVLNAQNIRGQGRVPQGSRLQVADLPPSAEQRTLLFSESIRHSNPNHYVHVERLSVLANRNVTLILSQGFGEMVFDEPYAHLQLDPKLAVTRVVPGAKLASLLSARYPSVKAPGEAAMLYRQVIADVVELRGNGPG